MNAQELEALLRALLPDIVQEAVDRAVGAALADAGIAPEFGVPVDFAGVIGDIYGDRAQGPAMRALIESAPTALLFHQDGVELSQDEIAILQYNRDLIESDPKWFVHRVGGGTLVREARDLDGQLIPGLLVIPNVNARVSKRQVWAKDEAIAEAKEWLATKANFAIMADGVGPTSGGFVAGDPLRRG